MANRNGTSSETHCISNPVSFACNCERVEKLIVLVTLFLLHVIVNFKHPNATTSCPSKKGIK